MIRVLVAIDSVPVDMLAGHPQLVVDSCSSVDVMVRLRSDDPVDAVVVSADPVLLTADLTRTCDMRGVRVVAVYDDPRGAEHARRRGVVGVPGDDAAALVRAVAQAGIGDWNPAAEASRERAEGRIIVVWGPPGAPGRSTLATMVAGELVRSMGAVALVDADTHAPSLALALGLSDEGPGFAAACRQSVQGALDAAELSRISQPVSVGDRSVRVLCGINRPARWPELQAERVVAALRACREWAEATVVDVAASLEQDEEVVSDLEGPRRNAATTAAISCADVIVAVGAADPVGLARLVRGLTDLRALAGGVPVHVVVNGLRPGAIGLDTRGQIRRTLARFADVDRVWFLPWDLRATDAALLRAQPIHAVAPRAPLLGAVRRFVAEALSRPDPEAGTDAGAASSRGEPPHAPEPLALRRHRRPRVSLRRRFGRSA